MLLENNYTMRTIIFIGQFIKPPYLQTEGLPWEQNVTL